MIFSQVQLNNLHTIPVILASCITRFLADQLILTPPWSSGYSYLPSHGLTGLRNYDIKDPIFQRSLNVVLIDGGREAETPGELAVAPFRNPIFLGRRLGLSGNVHRGGGVLVGRPFAFSRPVCRGTYWFFSDRSAGRRPRQKACGWRGGIGALSVTADNQGLRVRKLHLQIIPVYAWKLTIKMIRVWKLPDVKTGVKADATAKRATAI